MRRCVTTLSSLRFLHEDRSYSVVTAAESRELFAAGPKKLHRKWGLLYVEKPDDAHWMVLADKYPPDGFRAVWKLVGWPDEWAGGIDVFPYAKAVA